MKRTVIAAVVLAALSVSVGFAASRSTQVPTHVPNPLAEEVLLADRSGNALVCRGRLVRVERRALGGARPGLTPAQAVQAQSRARSGAPIAPELIAPSFEGFSCERDARGMETGDALARVTEPSGRVSTRTLRNTND